MHNITKFLLLALSAAVSFVTIAEEPQPAPGPRKKYSQKELQAKIRRVTMKKTGGTVRQPGSAKGELVILNAQEAVPAENLERAAAEVDRIIRIRVSVKNVKGATLADARKLVRSNGGQLGVLVVDDPAIPTTLLAAPESGWAFVNVAALKADAPTPEVLAARVRKETLRAFSFVGGGALPLHADFVMQDVTGLKDIDALPGETFGVEVMMKFLSTLPHYGITPWNQTTYKNACYQGWAPAPTNEFQQAIWDEAQKAKK